jgi:cysteine desulfurase / selenocysteine lyase
MSDLASYVGNADAFPVLRHWDFFNHAGVAPIPRAAADAMRKFAAEAEAGAYLGTTWYADLEKLRATAARLINASADEVALVKNTSEGIATVAAGIDWHPGDRIVTTAVEYPANIYPWMDVARRFGAELIHVPEVGDAEGCRRVPLDAILAAADHPRTRLVTLSHVEYASGQRHDLARIGRFCRENDKLLCVDAIQTVGVLPVDVRAMHVDYLAADGHKWMLGPEGAGIFYCRRELIDRTRPAIVGWMNVVDAEDYGHYDFTYKSNARKFEPGSHNVAGFMGLKAALELLSSVGVDAIAGRVKELTDHLVARLADNGYRVVSPRGEGQWSGGVSFVSPTHDHANIVRTLRREHHTEIALREKRLRASPHFYNTIEQIDRLIEHLPRH